LERVVASAGRRFEEAFAASVAARLGTVACDRLEDLLGKPGLLAELKSDPGSLGLDTLLVEIGKLNTVRSLGLAKEVFAEISDRIVAAWRARASRMFPSDFAECSEPVRYTLLAALCWTRQAELVDGLVELLIGLIKRINARAERRVEKELIGELAHVPGKRLPAFIPARAGRCYQVSVHAIPAWKQPIFVPCCVGPCRTVPRRSSNHRATMVIVTP
jgi:hypothetical protein